MGRRGSDLAPFIRKALKKNKYPNLKIISKNPLIFSLRFLRKTNNLDPAYEQLLKDWTIFKKRKYSYSKARQAVLTALKKSDFFQLISIQGDELVYQVLEDADILSKKRKKKEQIKKDKEYSDVSSIVSSGYGSGEETGVSSPEGREVDFEEDPESLPSDSMESDEMETESPEEDVMVGGEQSWGSDPNLVGYYNTLTTDDKLDLTPVNPNEILDARQNICPNIEELSDGDEKIFNVNNDGDFSFNNFALQHAFEDINTRGYDDSYDELMKIPYSELVEPQIPERSKMSLFHLNKILAVDDGKILIFSRKLADETNDGRNDSGSPSGIWIDKEELRKITNARHPITVGISNGEPFIYVKHKKCA